MGQSYGRRQGGTLQDFWKDLHDSGFSHFIYGIPFGVANGFKMARCQAGHFFELIAQVSYAAVAHLEGDFAERHFIVNEQFFHPLDFLGDKIFLKGSAFNGGKQVAQVGVIVVKFLD